MFSKYFAQLRKPHNGHFRWDRIRRLTMDVLTSPLTLAAVALGYLLGSIPFGLLLTRAAGLGDVRQIGSGNIGATNVLRTGNKRLAAFTLVLDALKGTAAVLIGRWLGEMSGNAHIAEITPLLAGLAAFLGHIFPLWLGFRGGKGVATYIGVLLGVDWRAALSFCAIWLLVAALTRYSSLSALVAAIVVPVGMFIMGQQFAAVLAGILSLMLIAKHRANIRRLLAGKEPRIGARE